MRKEVKGQRPRKMAEISREKGGEWGEPDRQTDRHTGHLKKENRC